MNLFVNINDLIFTMGTMVFLIAGFRQAKRIYKTKSTNGISLTHYHLKIFASSCMIVAYFRSALPISLLTSTLDLTITIVSIYLITKYRRIKFFGW